ncbi:MAG: hypothetical protein P4L91_16005 [Burkholderiaceae bacterium]|nr:hypothetical protein [Burkholderiaceae bacterium]
MSLCNQAVLFQQSRATHREVAEFSIEAFPSDLDRFANLLEQFSKLNHRVLEWNVNDGELRQQRSLVAVYRQQRIGATFAAVGDALYSPFSLTRKRRDEQVNSVSEISA